MVSHDRDSPDSPNLLDRFEVVLCRAEEGGNAGAVCRAMKTMGFSHLVLAGCAVLSEFDARMFSVHAFDLFEGARRVPDLASALAGADLTVGFTRRRGQRRKAWSVPVDQFAQEVWRRPLGRIALVFGNEKHGLSHEELALCDIAVHIPTSDAFPSLNLSHAVQIACWELARTAPERRPASYEPAPRDDVDAVVTRIAHRMTALGCFRIAGRSEAETFMRSAVARAALSHSELRYLESLAFKSLALGASSSILAPGDGGISEVNDASSSPSG